LLLVIFYISLAAARLRHFVSRWPLVSPNFASHSIAGAIARSFHRFLPEFDHYESRWMLVLSGKYGLADILLTLMQCSTLDRALPSFQPI
jgi:hypothetical protein